MADNYLKAASPLSGYVHTFEGTRVAEMDNLAIISLSVPSEGMQALNARLESLWSLSFPETGRWVRASDTHIANIPVSLALYGLQSDQIFLIAEAGELATCEFFEHVQQAISDVAYLTNQSDSWASLDIEGILAQPALERLCMLDLSSFDIGSVARTVMEQLAVIIERTDSTRFRMFSPRSSAMSFLHAVTTSLQNVSGSTTGS